MSNYYKLQKDFLKDLKSHVSSKVFRNYESGIHTFELFLADYSSVSGYDERKGIGVIDADVQSIAPEDVVEFLSYFVIRKMLWNSNTDFEYYCKSIDKFFEFAVEKNLYDVSDQKIIKESCTFYRKELPRANRLGKILWDYVEKETDDLMKLDGKAYEKRLKKLQDNVKAYKHKREPGYVRITKIDGDMVWGNSMVDGKKVGPVRFNESSSALVKLGDIINMLTIAKTKESEFWEIFELGNVYPPTFTY